jgi:hypothetical protein
MSCVYKSNVFNVFIVYKDTTQQSQLPVEACTTIASG